MKKPLIFISLLVAAIIAMAEVPVRYFVGDTEVPVEFWMSLPDSLKSGKLHFEYDSLVVEGCELAHTHFIDSVSDPGMFLLKRRSDAEIAAREALMAEMIASSRMKGLRVNPGDKAPQIQLMKNIDGGVIDEVIQPGKCYLLTFWATWCGNCLLELQPTHIPAVADEFKDNSDFIFLPVCIDATREDLTKFFATRHGMKWAHLAPITTLDTARKANGEYGAPGVMPLNVVIGKTGTVVYIHSGALLTDEALASLRAAVIDGLSQ